MLILTHERNTHIEKYRPEFVGCRVLSPPACPFDRTSAVVSPCILPFFTVGSVSTCRSPVLATQKIALLESVFFIFVFVSTSGGVAEVIKLYVQGIYSIRAGGGERTHCQGGGGLRRARLVLASHSPFTVDGPQTFRGGVFA